MLLYSSRTFDQIEQLQHIVWTHEKFFTSGENERYLTKLDMHIFFPRELQLLFLASGFSIEAIYGGYDWKPFGKGTRQIVVGRKRQPLPDENALSILSTSSVLIAASPTQAFGEKAPCERAGQRSRLSS